MGPVVTLFAFVLILTTAQSRHQHSSSHQLSRALSSRSSDSQSPVIVIIDTRGQSVQESDDSESSSDERDEDPGDEEAYQLYNHLRSHSQDGLSSGEVAKLKETKHILRAALVSRCRKMDSCARSCPPAKKFTCLVVCQETFDKENACDEPVEEPKCEEKKDKCGKKQEKWGKTMPPHWFFR